PERVRVIARTQKTIAAVEFGQDDPHLRIFGELMSKETGQSAILNDVAVVGFVDLDTERARAQIKESLSHFLLVGPHCLVPGRRNTQIRRLPEAAVVISVQYLNLTAARAI